jgi:2-polyprenyl-3-methyl-5-hydroxy-6-metoxy-1,4-benzoquinol methylase
MLASMPCTQAQLESPTFQRWAQALGERPRHLHRKIWEWCFIAQALEERDMLQPARRGLGFAVGQEPLTALFAARGCDILATDLATEEATKGGWIETGQHAAALDALNQRGLCPSERFARNVVFRAVDMRALPADLGQFDFLWSACALEHLGSLRAGLAFIQAALKLLRPGGVAVHTTEYNLTSNLFTQRRGDAVIYRRRDLTGLARRLQKQGYRLDLTFDAGDGPADKAVDRPPYTHDPHLKLQLGRYVATSYGLIIEQDAATL